MHQLNHVQFHHSQFSIYFMEDLKCLLTLGINYFIVGTESVSTTVRKKFSSDLLAVSVDLYFACVFI